MIHLLIVSLIVVVIRSYILRLPSESTYYSTCILLILGIRSFQSSKYFIFNKTFTSNAFQCFFTILPWMRSYIFHFSYCICLSWSESLTILIYRARLFLLILFRCCFPSDIFVLWIWDHIPSLIPFSLKHLTHLVIRFLFFILYQQENELPYGAELENFESTVIYV